MGQGNYQKNIMKKGTWHTLQKFPLHLPSVHFILVTNKETTDDLLKKEYKLIHRVDLKEKIGTILEFAGKYESS